MFRLLRGLDQSADGIAVPYNHSDHLPGLRKIGFGKAHSHFGEVFQGQMEHWTGRRQRCLVSLPCDTLRSWARYSPNGRESVDVEPLQKVRAKHAVEVLLDYLGVRRGGGVLTLGGNIPEAKGNGSSTSDCVASMRAASAAFGIHLGEHAMAHLAVQAEQASDSTMFNEAVLFAQREGIVVENYGKAFPIIYVIGVDTQENAQIDTLSYPAALYSRRQLQKFEILRGALRRAFRTNDVALLGQVATASALINQEFLPKPCLAELLAIVRHIGGLGITVAHSGTVAAILLDYRDALLKRKVNLICRALRESCIPVVARFLTRSRDGNDHGDRDHNSNTASISAGLRAGKPELDSGSFSSYEGLSGGVLPS